MKSVCYSFIFFLLILPAVVTSQNDNNKNINNQFWADYYQYYYFKPNLQFYGDAGVRTIPGEWSWFMAFARPSIRWKKHELLELHGGIGVFQTFNVDDVNTFEIRPWQGVKVNWPTFKPIRFNHYFRIEERINFPTDTWAAELNLRIRYRFSINILIHTLNAQSSIFLPAYVEFFGDIGQQITENYNNRSRIGVGGGYKMNDQWTFEADFVLQFSRSGGDDSFNTSDRLIQIKVRRFLMKKDYHSKLNR